MESPGKHLRKTSQALPPLSCLFFLIFYFDLIDGDMCECVCVLGLRGVSPAFMFLNLPR